MKPLPHLYEVELVGGADGYAKVSAAGIPELESAPPIDFDGPGDTTSRDEIREHLTHIAQMFSEGDFNAPMLIHAQTPPGVPEMKRLKGKISYKFEQTKGGGLVRISTADPQAVSPVHDFLRFQIREHQTGDPLTVSK